MDIRLTEGAASINAVTAISSKSCVHRLLIAASLYGGARIATNIFSKDMEATVSVLNSLGAKINVKTENGNGYIAEIAEPLNKSAEGSVTADCGESGSTARFLLPVAPFFAENATLTGSGRLPERPMGPLCDVLKSGGVTVSSDHLPITVSGRLKAGDYEIEGNVSSQYISGLLFALPLAGGRSGLKIKGKLESAGYVRMTVDVLRKFGAEIIEEDGRFIIEPFDAGDTDTEKTIAGDINSESVSSADSDAHIIRAEGDWSNSAYVMVLASLGADRFPGGFTIEGLNPDSIQGDRAAAGILRRFGIDVSESPCGDGTSAYTITGRPENPIDIDCSQIPDLVPALAVLAAYADGKSVFRNVERLRIKECDRVSAIEKLLSSISVQVDITSEDGSETMTVTGKGSDSPVDHPIEADSFNDHRIAMAAAALAFAEKEPVVIKDAMSVNKSYPGFFELVRKMGIETSKEI